MSVIPFDSQEDEEDLYGFDPVSTFSQSSNTVDSIAPSSSISNAPSSSNTLTSLRASGRASRYLRVSADNEEGLEVLKEYKVPLSLHFN
jgi:hypothetical protein